jgi:hypothetical protein
MRIFLISAALLGLAGCSGRPAAPPKEAKPQVEVKAPRVDSAQIVAERLRQTGEPGHLTDLLESLNPLLETPEAQARLQPRPERRDFLRQRVHLADDELAEVEAAAFRPGDAYYLQECALLRDAAGLLEVRGLGVPEQAQLACRWVARNVLLHEQLDDWLPNAFVLTRGHGGARARALALLALLRQFHAGKAGDQQVIEGCVLALPAPEPAPVLVAVLDPNDQQLYLFDPRLGAAVARRGKGIATWKDVQADPSLLQPSGLTPAQVKELQPLLVCPLSALAPRVAELESILLRHDRIKLHLDAAALEKKISDAAGQPARVWNAPAQGERRPNSPTRALRLFLPPEEGVDRSLPPRLAQFGLRVLPRLQLVQALEQLLLARDLHPVAYRVLNEKVIGPMFMLYYEQPRDNLLRGQYDAMFGRFDRVRPFLDDEVLVPASVDEPAFARGVAKWREMANTLYLNKDPRAEAVFFVDDQYLGTLLTENEEAAEKFKKFDKGTLSRILAYVSRDLLQQRMSWLEACCKDEIAERAQAAADAAAASAPAAQKASKAWLTARGVWNFYLSRTNLGPAALRQRLAAVQTQLRDRNPERALTQLETLHLDLHRYYAAKYHLGVATARLEGERNGARYARSVARELEELVKNDSADAGLQQCLVRTQQLIDTIPPPQQGNLKQRADLLGRDWGEQGSMYWLRQSFDNLAASGGISP